MFRDHVNTSDGCVDMVFCDVPMNYGTTQNEWDVLIPFDKLWLYSV